MKKLRIWAIYHSCRLLNYLYLLGGVDGKGFDGVGLLLWRFCDMLGIWIHFYDFVEFILFMCNSILSSLIKYCPTPN